MELWRSNGGALEAPTVDFGEGADLPKDKVLSYRVSMTAGVQQRGGNLTLNGASTPIFDSLTVVYQLPKRRVLVKERVFD